MKVWLVLVATLFAADLAAQEQPPSDVPYKQELPSGLRAWFRNPDG